MRAIPTSAGSVLQATDTAPTGSRSANTGADGDAFAALLANGLHGLPGTLGASPTRMTQDLPAATSPQADAAQTTTAQTQAQAQLDQQRAQRLATERDSAQARAVQDAQAAAQQTALAASQAQAQSQASAQQAGGQAHPASDAPSDGSLPAVRPIGAGYTPLAADANAATVAPAGTGANSPADGHAQPADGSASANASATAPGAEAATGAAARAHAGQAGQAGSQGHDSAGHPAAGAAVTAHAEGAAVAANPASVAGGTQTGSGFAADGSLLAVGATGTPPGSASGTPGDASLQNLMGALQANLDLNPPGAAGRVTDGLAGAALFDGALAGVAGFGLGGRNGLTGVGGELADALTGVPSARASGALASASGAPDSRTAFNPLATDALQLSAASTPEAVGPTLPVAPAVGDTRWAAALGQQALFMATQQLSSAQLSINPPHLGPVQITLDVQQGQATASFVTAHDAVRHAIEGSLPQLRDMFAAAGMDLTQAQVQVQADASGNPARQSPADWQASGRRDGSDAAADPLAGSRVGSVTATPATRTAQRGLLDTFA